MKHPVHLEMPAPKKWLTFLLGRENKANLAQCYKEYMKANASVILKADQSLYISTGDDVVKFTKNTTENVQELKSNTEESDTYCLFTQYSLPITDLKGLLCTPLIMMYWSCFCTTDLL